MISRDTFIETMCALEILDDKMGNVEVAMNQLCPDFRGFNIPDVFDIVMDIFEEMFKDEDNWLDYFVYELDYMNDYIHGDVLDKNGQPIEFHGWGDVYDFLIKNMEG